jgi:hypothetical protein
MIDKAGRTAPVAGGVAVIGTCPPVRTTSSGGTAILVVSAATQIKDSNAHRLLAMDPPSKEASVNTFEITAERSPLRAALPCPHHPRCPSAEKPNRDLAHIRIAHPEQGWSLLCNGVIVFDDTGELLPDGRAIPPQRARCSFAD